LPHHPDRTEPNNLRVIPGASGEVPAHVYVNLYRLCRLHGVGQIIPVRCGVAIYFSLLTNYRLPDISDTGNAEAPR
jgi:hypothetical protein